MIPYTRPHDQDGPGLRDYRAQVAQDPPSFVWVRWVLLAMIATVLLSLYAFTLIGCVGITPARQGHYTPEPLHPSLDRIAELAAISNQPSITNPGWLRLSSPFVLAGNGVRLTCLVPEHRDHRYLRLSLVDAVGPLWTITHATQTDHLLIESVPCGSYAAVCDSLANSDRVLAHYEQRFTSKGSCNDGGDR